MNIYEKSKNGKSNGVLEDSIGKEGYCLAVQFTINDDLYIMGNIPATDPILKAGDFVMNFRFFLLIINAIDHGEYSKDARCFDYTELMRFYRKHNDCNIEEATFSVETMQINL